MGQVGHVRHVGQNYPKFALSEEVCNSRDNCKALVNLHVIPSAKLISTFLQAFVLHVTPVSHVPLANASRVSSMRITWNNWGETPKRVRSFLRIGASLGACTDCEQCRSKSQALRWEGQRPRCPKSSKGNGTFCRPAVSNRHAYRLMSLAACRQPPSSYGKTILLQVKNLSVTYERNLRCG